MFCQVCGSLQNDETEYCDRCNQKLLVVSGPGADEIQLEEQRPEDNFSFDEHLLERISVLEEVVKRTAETVRDILSTLQKQEKNLLINQTGLDALRRHAAGQGRDRDPRSGARSGSCARRSQLLALEKRERFAACRDRIEALYRGKRREAFLRQLRQARECTSCRSSWKRRSRRSRPPTRSTAPTTSWPTSSARPGSTRATPRRRCATSRACSSSSPTTTSAWSTAASSSTSSATSRAPRRSSKRAVRGLPRRLPAALLPGRDLRPRRQAVEQAASYLERAVRAESVPQAYYLLGSVLPRAVAPAAGDPRAAQRDAPRSRLRGGAPPARPHLPRPSLAAQGARVVPPGAAAEPEEDALPGSGRLPVRALRGAAAARSRARRPSGSSAPRRACRAIRPRRRCAATAARCASSPRTRRVLMSYALACLQLNRHQEIEAITRKVLDLNPGEMLRATAYAALIEALRGEGKYREGNRIGGGCSTRAPRTSRRPSPTTRWPTTWRRWRRTSTSALDYAQQSLELAPEELKQFPLAALGWVHYKRREFDQAVEFLDALERARALADHPHPPGHGAARLRATRSRRARRAARSAPQSGPPRRRAGGEDDGVHARLAPACSSALRRSPPAE